MSPLSCWSPQFIPTCHPMHGPSHVIQSTVLILVMLSLPSDGSSWGIPLAMSLKPQPSACQSIIPHPPCWTSCTPLRTNLICTCPSQLMPPALTAPSIMTPACPSVLARLQTAPSFRCTVQSLNFPHCNLFSYPPLCHPWGPLLCPSCLPLLSLLFCHGTCNCQLISAPAILPSSMCLVLTTLPLPFPQPYPFILAKPFATGFCPASCQTLPSSTLAVIPPAPGGSPKPSQSRATLPLAMTLQLHAIQDPSAPFLAPPLGLQLT